MIVDILRRFCLSIQLLHEGKKETNRVFNSVSFTFMLQKLGHSTARVVKLPMATPATPKEAFSNMCLGVKMFKKMATQLSLSLTEPPRHFCFPRSPERGHGTTVCNGGSRLRFGSAIRSTVSTSDA